MEIRLFSKTKLKVYLTVRTEGETWISGLN